MTLKNKGKSQETIKTYVGSLYTLINKGARLQDPKKSKRKLGKTRIIWALISELISISMNL